MKMFYLLILSTIVFVSLLVVNVFATTATIQPPTIDSYINQASPGTNSGSSEVLRVESFLSEGSSNKRTLLKFDLSAIPDSVTITDATLSLNYYDFDGNDPVGRSYNTYPVTAVWTETGVTWNDRTASEPWTSAGGDFDATKSSSSIVPSIFDWMSWNVTDIVIEWYSSALTNNGFLIKDDTEDSTTDFEAKFHSSEFSDDPSLRPKLEITFVSCDISLNASSISFGSVSPGEESSEHTINVTNTGTDPGDVSVSGTGWDSVLPVSRTGFSGSSGDYSTKTALSTEEQLIITDLAPDTPTNTFWQFKAEADDPAGNYSQTITFTSEC